MYPDGQNMFIVPNHKKNLDYHENQGLSHFLDNVDSKETVEVKAFLANPKHQNRASQ